MHLSEGCPGTGSLAAVAAPAGRSREPQRRDIAGTTLPVASPAALWRSFASFAVAFGVPSAVLHRRPCDGPVRGNPRLDGRAGAGRGGAWRGEAERGAAGGAAKVRTMQTDCVHMLVYDILPTGRGGARTAPGPADANECRKQAAHGGHPEGCDARAAPQRHAVVDDSEQGGGAGEPSLPRRIPWGKTRWKNHH